MGIFGWCNDGKHSDCIKEYRRFWFEKRKRKEVVIYADELTKCDCPCHTGSRRKPPTKKRRKK